MITTEMFLYQLKAIIIVDYYSLKAAIENALLVKKMQKSLTTS
jgi:hypothetical protein